MACPQENNIVVKRNEKRKKYRPLAFELRERRIGYKIIVVSLVISAIDGGIEGMIREVERIFGKNDLCTEIVGEMQKTILMDSETTIWKVLSGLAKSDHI